MNPRAGFLKMISVGMMTYAAIKLVSRVEVGPRNQFSC